MSLSLCPNIVRDLNNVNQLLIVTLFTYNVAKREKWYEVPINQVSKTRRCKSKPNKINITHSHMWYGRVKMYTDITSTTKNKTRVYVKIISSWMWSCILYYICIRFSMLVKRKYTIM